MGASVEEDDYSGKFLDVHKYNNKNEDSNMRK